MPRNHSNGRIICSRVRYKALAKSDLQYITQTVSQTNSTFGENETVLRPEWLESISKSNCAMLRLSSKMDYEVVVNSNTSAGFNDSLTLDSIKILSSDKLRKFIIIFK